MSQPRRSAPRRNDPPPRRRWGRILLATIAVLVAVGAALFFAAFAATSIPSPNDVATSEATIVYYSDGEHEIGRLGEATRRSVTLDQVPLDVQHAVLAAEDRTFYEHGGISPLGIARSAMNNVTGGSTQGGSTITQQYAKVAYLTMDRTWNRKIKEALLAFKLETVVSKDQILEDYLNTIYFGRGANGIEAASIAYFGQPVSELDLSQGAMLAAIINSPNGMAPEENLPRLKDRWNYVLDGMVQQGWITPEQRDAAQFPEIKKAKAGNRLGGQVGYLLNAVTDELIARGYDETEIQRGGFSIVSTIDRKAQKAAVKAVKEQGPTTGTDGLRIGLAAVRPGTGEIVAMYGGPDYIENQINNATKPFAQAGSTFKPFALTAATESGIPLSSMWDGNSPTTISGYTFENYGNHSYGQVTLLTATENSINSAYVAVENEVGVQKVQDAALRAGIPESTPGMNLETPDLTFVLGTASPSGLDVAGAYATFANQGVRATPTIIKSVTGSNGGLLYELQPETEAAFTADVANTVTYALNKVVTHGTGFEALKLGRPAAGKTGTTDDNKSAWFSGYTPQLATAVLMAKEDADGQPISMSGTGGMKTVTGGSFPARIWVAFMKAALADEPTMEFPAPPAGVAVPDNCPDVMPENPDDLPFGCPTPSVVEFGPSAVPTDAENPTDLPTAPAETVDPATVAPSPSDQPPAQDAGNGGGGNTSGNSGGGSGGGAKPAPGGSAPPAE